MSRIISKTINSRIYETGWWDNSELIYTFYIKGFPLLRMSESYSLHPFAVVALEFLYLPRKATHVQWDTTNNQNYLNINLYFLSFKY